MSVATDAVEGGVAGRAAGPGLAGLVGAARMTREPRKPGVQNRASAGGRFGIGRVVTLSRVGWRRCCLAPARTCHGVLRPAWGWRWVRWGLDTP